VSEQPIKLHLVAAARPNFMKVAPLYHALANGPRCHTLLIHTGQHYDREMSELFFRALRIPDPDFHLGVGSGTHAEQTAGVMVAYERVCLEHRPHWIIVVGDVNSTLAAALVAAMLGVRVAHLEAGLRSGDRTMPEELNRLLTDDLADLLWTPSPDADRNLQVDGVPAERIVRVGNTMIDSFETLRERIAAERAPAAFGVEAGGYGLVTLHRASNVDHRVPLAHLLEALLQIARATPLIFPIHPRTRARVSDSGSAASLGAHGCS
jgi:UDP-N-acetylglucosamine 2-epimerase (non-hydrolysing)